VALAILFGVSLLFLAWFSVIPLIADFQIFTYRIPDGDPVVVRGRTTRPAEVELLINRASRGRTTTRSNGEFEFPGVSFEYGKTRLEFRARSVFLGRTLGAGELVEMTNTPDPPVVRALAQTVNRPVVVVRGFAAPDADVVVWQFAQAFRTLADDEGRFRAVVDLPDEPGDYPIEAQSIRRRGRVSMPSDAIWVTYDPEAESTANEPERKVTISLGYRDFGVDVETTLGQSDPWVEALLTGRGTLAGFVEKRFSRLWIGKAALPSFFENVTPRISLANGAATIQASSHPASHRWPIVGAWGGRLQLGRYPPDREGRLRGYPIDSDGEALTLNVRDYRVEALEPLPNELNDDGATWRGGATSSDGTASENGISARLTYGIWRNPVRALAVTPLDVFSELQPHWMAALGSLGALIFVVPLLWAWSLLGRAESDGTARRWVVWLIALTLVVPAQAAAMTLGDAAYGFVLLNGLPRVLRPLEPDSTMRLIAAVGIAAVAFSVAGSFRHWPRLS